MNSGELPPVAPSGANPDSRRVSVPAGGDQRRRRSGIGRPRKLSPGNASAAGDLSAETLATAKDAYDDADRGSTVDVRV